MKTTSLPAAPLKKSRMILLAGAVAVCFLFVLLANLHLVYVAVTSQPDCVAHVRADVAPATGGSFAAANSSC